MIINSDLDIKSSEQAAVPLTLNSWARGVITLVDQSNLPYNALKEAVNVWLEEEGTPRPRPGIDWYGTAPSGSTIDGAASYVTSDELVHLIVVSGGTVWRSTNDGTTWTACTGGTLTAGYKVRFEQANPGLYIVNGQDAILRYDGSTVLQAYSSLPPPSMNAPTEVGLTGTARSYYYKVSAVNTIGFTESSSASTAVQADLSRDQWSSTNYATLSCSTVTGATRYDWFVAESSSGPFYYLDSTAATTYVDYGTAVPNTTIEAPTENTTTGPRIGFISFVGSRLWGTMDKNNKWRVWWTGSSTSIGYFASGYDGGYIDLQKGSQFRPVAIKDYRDGKGTPMATVWCKSKDGLGCVWQISLETVTFDQFTFTVPNAFKLPGSRGTESPDSVIAVLNDFMYYNSQAFYNLGSRPQLLNVLSTDETSANVRPSVKQITPSAAHKITSIYQDAKVYFSVPVGSSNNNRIMIFDTERRAWLPDAFTVGVNGFLSYTDTTGSRHLLCWKEGDSRLSEISRGLQGDYGVAFSTSLVTGLFHVNPKDRFQFARDHQAMMEFSRPNGDISVELIGIEKRQGYRSVKSLTINQSYDPFSWNTRYWNSFAWNTAITTPTTFSESSVKRFFDVRRELNAYQWRVTTNAISADYLLRTLQVTVTASFSGMPRTWKIRA